MKANNNDVHPKKNNYNMLLWIRLESIIYWNKKICFIYWFLESIAMCLRAPLRLDMNKLAVLVPGSPVIGYLSQPRVGYADAEGVHPLVLWDTQGRRVDTDKIFTPKMKLPKGLLMPQRTGGDCEGTFCIRLYCEGPWQNVGKWPSGLRPGWNKAYCI